jgi:hypothetical protein
MNQNEEERERRKQYGSKHKFVSVSKHEVIEVCVGEMVIHLPAFLSSALDEGECSASSCGRFIPGTYWIGV